MQPKMTDFPPLFHRVCFFADHQVTGVTTGTDGPLTWTYSLIKLSDMSCSCVLLLYYNVLISVITYENTNYDNVKNKSTLYRISLVLTDNYHGFQHIYLGFMC